MYTLIFMLIGFLAAYMLNIRDFQNSTSIIYISNIALAIGLYGSVYGIDIKKLKKNMKIVFYAISIGVLLKTLIIGGILWLYIDSPMAFLLAAIVAQIDPLSISALKKSKFLSKDSETVLRAWSSFDDPVTIIFSLWIATFIYVNNEMNLNSIILSSAIIIYYNIIMATGVYLLWRILKPLHKIFTCFSLLILSFFLAINYDLFLGLAIIALFVRPPLYGLEEKIIFITLLIVSFILGVLLSNGFNFLIGFIIGILTIISQAIVTFLLTKKMSFNDKVKLSVAHQSGITAISLSLYFAQYDSYIIKSISVAIITINIGYIVLNWVVDSYVIPLHSKKI